MGALNIAMLAGNNLRLTAPAFRQALTDWRDAETAQVSVTLSDGSTAQLDSLSREQLAEVITGLKEGQPTQSAAAQPVSGAVRSPAQGVTSGGAEAQSAPAARPPAAPPPSVAAPPPAPPAAGSPRSPQAPQSPQAQQGEMGASSAGADVGQALTIIAAYVPAEALAAYIAITALLTPVTLGGRVVVATIALGLNLLFVLVGIRRADRLNPVSTDQSVRRQSKLLTIAATTWALAVYVASIPANVFTSFDWYRMQYGGVVAIVTALVLPLVVRPQTARSA